MLPPRMHQPHDSGPMNPSRMALHGSVMESAGSAAPAAAPVATASCHQQYMAWKTGPADAEGKKMESALNAIQAAGDDMVTLQSGLKHAGAIARQLQAYPIPSCADLGGYWKQILTEITAAGDNAGTATGLTAAEVPLQKVPALESKLTMELKSTA
jgi:hypothetical protein